MKRLAIMNEKGGVGKSMAACQFAFYAALKRGLRVLVLDFDQQGNTTNTLTHSGKCCVATVSTGKLLVNAEVPSAEELDAPFVPNSRRLAPGGPDLTQSRLIYSS